ncbi:MAG: hypothetical protein HY255_06355 [Betaproteobacteria bacterium]|nr:hypothetical protein [Betaproteobacteria bacterium]
MTLPASLCLWAMLGAAGGVCAEETKPVVLETPAQTYYKKLPRDEAPTQAQRNLVVAADESVKQPKRRSTAQNEEPQRIEEFRIYSYRHPEDYVTPQKTPLLQMRDQLAGVHRSTPAEKVQGALCLIGLCGGIPPEISAEARNDARMVRSTLQLQAMGGSNGP